MSLSIKHYWYYQYQEGKEASRSHSTQGHRGESGQLDWCIGAGVFGPPGLGAQSFGQWGKGCWSEAQTAQQILQARSGTQPHLPGAPTGRRLTTVTCQTVCDGPLVPRGRPDWWHAAMTRPPRSTLRLVYPSTAALPPTLTTLQLHPQPPWNWRLRAASGSRWACREAGLTANPRAEAGSGCPATGRAPRWGGRAGRAVRAGVEAGKGRELLANPGGGFFFLQFLHSCLD